MQPQLTEADADPQRVVVRLLRTVDVPTLVDYRAANNRTEHRRGQAGDLKERHGRGQIRPENRRRVIGEPEKQPAADTVSHRTATDTGKGRAVLVKTKTLESVYFSRQWASCDDRAN